MRKSLLLFATAFTWLFVLNSGAFAASTTLVAPQVQTPPLVDGKVDRLWDDLQPLIIKTRVPDYDAGSDKYEDKWWDGYEGQEKTATMKSVYTDDKIYFLFQWNDNEDSRERQSWYYNKLEGKWMQKPKYVADKYGMPPAYEDKFTVFWNMSIADFEEGGCAMLCHGIRMRTNGPGEKADIWHWKRNRGGPVGIIDDKWLDDAENGRHGDPGESTYSGNKQELEFNGEMVTAPQYWIPGRQDYHWIMKSDIDQGVAKKIVKMDKSRNLIDEDGNVLKGEDFLHSSPRVIPSLANIKMGSGSRADVHEAHNFSNGTWTLEVVRKRDTGDPEHDVQFTKRGFYYLFSIGIMDNQAIAHSTPDGFAGTVYKLTLK